MPATESPELLMLERGPIIDPRLLGKAVKRFCRTSASFNLLDRLSIDEHGVKADTWTAGGCWILADAIQKQFGGELVIVVAYGLPFPQHVAVRMGDFYIDADGASRRATLLKRWRRELFALRPAWKQFPRPALGPANLGQLRQSRIPQPKGQEEIINGIRAFLLPSEQCS